MVSSPDSTTAQGGLLQSSSMYDSVSERLGDSSTGKHAQHRHRFHHRPPTPDATLMTSTIEFTEMFARITVDNLHTLPCSTGVTASSQCLNALMCRPPKAFKAKHSHDTETNVVDLVIDISLPLLRQIPLLFDIYESTVDSSSGRKKTAFQAPCPAWGLISLLYLMERSVKMQHWLGGADAAPCLAGLTLQMADFLQVGEQRERITDWLRSLLHSLCGLNHKMVAEEPECERPAPDARELKQMLHDTQRTVRTALVHKGRIVFRTIFRGSNQVLSALPEPLCPGVYSHFHNEVVLASAAYYAVELPPALLCTWVRCNTPRINLTGTKLTVQEWIKLLHSISHAADVLELLVDAPEAPQITSHSAHASVDILPRQDVWPPPAAGAGPPDPLTPNGSSIGGMTGTARHSTPHSMPPTELTGLQWVLTALDSACMHLRHLRVLDFNRLPIYAHHLHLLGRVFHSMSSSLEDLRVWGFEDWHSDVPEAARNSYTPETKELFFRTVSMLQGLRNLWLPVWKGFVGTDSKAAQALLDLESLDVVWVCETDYSEVVAYEKLNFRVIQKDASMRLGGQ